MSEVSTTGARVGKAIPPVDAATPPSAMPGGLDGVPFVGDEGAESGLNLSSFYVAIGEPWKADDALVRAIERSAKDGWPRDAAGVARSIALFHRLAGLRRQADQTAPLLHEASRFVADLEAAGVPGAATLRAENLLLHAESSALDAKRRYMGGAMDAKALEFEGGRGWRELLNFCDAELAAGRADGEPAAMLKALSLRARGEILEVELQAAYADAAVDSYEGRWSLQRAEEHFRAGLDEGFAASSPEAAANLAWAELTLVHAKLRIGVVDDVAVREALAALRSIVEQHPATEAAAVISHPDGWPARMGFVDESGRVVGGAGAPPAAALVQAVKAAAARLDDAPGRALASCAAPMLALALADIAAGTKAAGLTAGAACLVGAGIDRVNTVFIEGRDEISLAYRTGVSAVDTEEALGSAGIFTLNLLMMSLAGMPAGAAHRGIVALAAAKGSPGARFMAHALRRLGIAPTPSWMGTAARLAVGESAHVANAYVFNEGLALLAENLLPDGAHERGPADLISAWFFIRMLSEAHTRNPAALLFAGAGRAGRAVRWGANTAFAAAGINLGEGIASGRLDATRLSDDTAEGILTLAALHAGNRAVGGPLGRLTGPFDPFGMAGRVIADRLSRWSDGARGAAGYDWTPVGDGVPRRGGREAWPFTEPLQMGAMGDGGRRDAGIEYRHHPAPEEEARVVSDSDNQAFLRRIPEEKRFEAAQVFVRLVTNLRPWEAKLLVALEDAAELPERIRELMWEYGEDPRAMDEAIAALMAEGGRVKKGDSRTPVQRLIEAMPEDMQRGALEDLARLKEGLSDEADFELAVDMLRAKDVQAKLKALAARYHEDKFPAREFGKRATADIVELRDIFRGKAKGRGLAVKGKVAHDDGRWTISTDGVDSRTIFAGAGDEIDLSPIGVTEGRELLFIHEKGRPWQISAPKVRGYWITATDGVPRLIDRDPVELHDGAVIERRDGYPTFHLHFSVEGEKVSLMTEERWSRARSTRPGGDGPQRKGAAAGRGELPAYTHRTLAGNLTIVVAHRDFDAAVGIGGGADIPLAGLDTRRPASFKLLRVDRKFHVSAGTDTLHVHDGKGWNPLSDGAMAQLWEGAYIHFEGRTYRVSVSDAEISFVWERETAQGAEGSGRADARDAGPAARAADPAAAGGASEAGPAYTKKNMVGMTMVTAHREGARFRVSVFLGNITVNDPSPAGDDFTVVWSNGHYRIETGFKSSPVGDSSELMAGSGRLILKDVNGVLLIFYRSGVGQGATGTWFQTRSAPRRGDAITIEPKAGVRSGQLNISVTVSDGKPQIEVLEGLSVGDDAVNVTYLGGSNWTATHRPSGVASKDLSVPMRFRIGDAELTLAADSGGGLTATATALSAVRQPFFKPLQGGGVLVNSSGSSPQVIRISMMNGKLDVRRRFPPEGRERFPLDDNEVLWDGHQWLGSDRKPFNSLHIMVYGLGYEVTAIANGELFVEPMNTR